MLSEIIKNKHNEVEKLKNELDISHLKFNKRKSNFYKNLLNNQNNKKNSIIAEVKRKSPSKGVLDDNINVNDIVTKYELGGASCISVLTEKKYFNGSNDDLLTARNSTNLPILRKDFMLDPIQIYESKMLGADCILLIVSALSEIMYKELSGLAHQLELDVLTEVHDKHELEFALSNNARLIGINNRNLKTFDVDINVSKNLSHLVNDNQIVLVSESGIHSRADIVKLNNEGIFTFLIGEHLVKSSNIKNELEVLLNGE
jgi:indole-3-glycerol phosphate synthase